MTKESEVGAEASIETIELDSLDSATALKKEGIPRKIEQTRAKLAYMLFFLLAGLLAVLLFLLGTSRLSVQAFIDVCGVVLAPVVALLGAATGYYYGRADR